MTPTATASDTDIATRTRATRFGAEHHRWRTIRRVSQLDLAIRAGTTQRHVSYIERGLPSPGRTIVVRLAESLDLSLRDRNGLLLAAGFALLFAESSLDSPELRPAREALLSILEAHMPYDARLDELVVELETYLPTDRPGPDFLGFAVPLLIPLITVLFLAVHRHYRKVREAIRLRPEDLEKVVRHTVVVLVAGATRPAIHAIRYAQAMRPDHLFALTVLHDGQIREEVEKAWEDADVGIPLKIIEDEYRDLTEPIEAFLTDTDARWADGTLTVVIPEFVVHRWWEHLLHNQSALMLKARLLYRRDTVVTSVPWHID